MTPITKKDGTIHCRRCQRLLGQLEDQGVSLRCGNIRLFGYRVRFFCVCGKVYHFSERNLGGHATRDFPEATHEILNALGRDYVTDEHVRNASKETYRKKFKLGRED